MAYRAENEKVAKLKRAIIDGSARRYKESTLKDIYSDEKLGKTYQKWHFNILTDFMPGEAMQEMIDVLSLLYIKKVDLDNYRPWLLYYAHKSMLFAEKISSLSDLAKIAFMEQDKKEEEIGDTKEWLLFPKDNSS
jgi:hypothetical protein